MQYVAADGHLCVGFHQHMRDQLFVPLPIDLRDPLHMTLVSAVLELRHKDRGEQRMRMLRNMRTMMVGMGFSPGYRYYAGRFQATWGTGLSVWVRTGMESISNVNRGMWNAWMVHVNRAGMTPDSMEAIVACAGPEYQDAPMVWPARR